MVIGLDLFIVIFLKTMQNNEQNYQIILELSISIFRKQLNWLKCILFGRFCMHEGSWPWCIFQLIFSTSNDLRTCLSVSILFYLLPSDLSLFLIDLRLMLVYLLTATVRRTWIQLESTRFTMICQSSNFYIQKLLFLFCPRNYFWWKRTYSNKRGNSSFPNGDTTLLNDI